MCDVDLVRTAGTAKLTHGFAQSFALMAGPEWQFSDWQELGSQVPWEEPLTL
jgi:hypothetical protein